MIFKLLKSPKLGLFLFVDKIFMLYLASQGTICTEEGIIIASLVKRFKLTMIYHPPMQDMYLCWEKNALTLRNRALKMSLKVDFNQLHPRARRFHSELLIKAVNTKKYPLIWDATAGLGTDAFIMASAGATVTLFEHHPWIGALLADGLRRAYHNNQLRLIIARMTLHFGEINHTTCNALATPDIVYLDPMFPQQKKKSTLVKKNMQLLHGLFRESKNNDDNTLLFTDAFTFARHKVVVKRNRTSLPIVRQIDPDYVITGPTVRYDVYLSRKYRSNI